MPFRASAMLLVACALVAQDRAPRFVSSPDVHGDRVVFTDLNNRVLLYSLNGQRMGQMFGGRPVVSRDNSRLVIEHAPGRLALYELPSLRKLDDFTFATRVLYAALSADGQQLLVVTDDQTLFMLGVTQSGVAKATN